MISLCLTIIPHALSNIELPDIGVSFYNPSLVYSVVHCNIDWNDDGTCRHSLTLGGYKKQPCGHNRKGDEPNDTKIDFMYIFSSLHQQFNSNTL